MRNEKKMGYVKRADEFKPKIKAQECVKDAITVERD